MSAFSYINYPKEKDILIDLVMRIFMFLPSEFIYGIGNLVRALLFFVWFVLGFIIVVKIFKSRYLDYYLFLSQVDSFLK